MTDIQKFTEDISTVIDGKSLLKHPFYVKWSEGKLTKEELKEYAKQYYFFVKHFPRYVSCVHSNCDDRATRDMLMQNLADEEGYKTGINNHPELWMNFAKSLGLTKEEVKNVEPLRETEDLVEGMYELARSSEYELGLAALYAYESQVPEIADTKTDGLKKFYNIDTKEALEYFDVHSEADIYHSKDELDAIINKCETEEERKRVVNTAEEAAALQWNFLDGIYNNYSVN